MQKLVAGIHHFRNEVFRVKQEMFADLVEGQSPLALFITCSDSRIDPSLLTQTQPGELFIMRNAGNIVPPYGAVQGGEAATIEDAVRALKANDADGELQVHGSVGLLQTLLAVHGLVDELRVLTFPVVTGPGKRLFGDAVAPGAWRVTGSSTTGTGVVICVLRPDGPLRSGGFGVEDGVGVVTT